MKQNCFGDLNQEPTYIHRDKGGAYFIRICCPKKVIRGGRPWIGPSLSLSVLIVKDLVRVLKDKSKEIEAEHYNSAKATFEFAKSTDKELPEYQFDQGYDACGQEIQNHTK
ncbi:hypothetical protein Fcan01_17777 [Folsomia candida]|uniref:Uncharacterized protein n=1 Tax=Folsomia candida TaxID=158441 RepID=A0A226DRK2_FOLCA|nr:hypothetical protein Fcan01_17777 [Folsomia candida]